MSKDHFKHPSRYPVHEGDKGQVYAGVCNRTACHREDATTFNVLTRGYYCRMCAAKINYNPTQPLICIPVTAAVDPAEMDRLFDEDVKQRFS